MKRNIKLFATLLAIAIVVAAAGIFYACTKDNNVVNNLTKEAEFIARIFDGTCVQVDVFRDENGNAQFVTKNVDKDAKATTGFLISDALHIEPLQTKDNAETVFEIPNDAIYWLVPF